jgi:predicted outer membrane protein
MRIPALLLAAVLATLTTACGDDESNAAARREARAAEERAQAQEERREERFRERNEAESRRAAELAAQAAENAPRPTPKLLQDSDAVALMIAIDEHEVALARLAQERTQNVHLQQFAKAMETEHAADRLEARKLEKTAGPITDADLLRDLKERNATELTRLQETPDGLPFDALYLETRQEAFAATTTLIDGRLATGSRMATVKDYLAKAKAAIADRQARAATTQQEL